MVLSSGIMQLSIPLPRSLDTRIHIHLDIKSKAATLFLTSVTQDEATGPAALGSFVYALPNVISRSHIDERNPADKCIRD